MKNELGPSMRWISVAASSQGPCKVRSPRHNSSFNSTIEDL